MKIVLVSLSIILLVLMGLAADRANVRQIRERCASGGDIVSVQRALWNKGPYWWVHKNEPVFRVEYRDGGVMWAYKPLFSCWQFHKEQPPTGPSRE